MPDRLLAKNSYHGCHVEDGVFMYIDLELLLQLVMKTRTKARTVMRVICHSLDASMACSGSML